MWIYMLGKFIHDCYAGVWYNGQFERTPEYIGNKASMLIGMPRLRQLRIKEGKTEHFLYLKVKLECQFWHRCIFQEYAL